MDNELSDRYFGENIYWLWFEGLPLFNFIYNWRVIAYSVILVSVIQQHKSAISVFKSAHSWTSFPPSTPFHPSRLSQRTGLNSLCHRVNSHWLSILCICVNASLPNHPTISFPNIVHKSVLCLCLHCCPANRCICTIFRDSVYMC